MRVALALFVLPAILHAQGDLEGVWTNATLTPIERPKALAGKEFYTDAEMADIQQRALQPGSTEDLKGTGAHYDFQQFGLDPSQTQLAFSKRTSIVIDPPDGRIPPLTGEGQRREAAREAERKRHNEFDGPETRFLSERCIVWPREGPPMLPEPYNSNLEIRQGKGYVAIVQEMNHDARIILLDGSPHPGPNVHQYLGDSRGHWEGRTLVVDVTNFKDNTNYMGAGESLHVIERFTRTDPDTILYQFTVEDPHTWARPWKGELLLKKTKGPLFEFACHEGNYGMINTLSGARAAERRLR
jgi:hypothetical protein